MNFLLIILFAVIFPITHVLNGWVFKFAEISPHIGLIYLPAFMRLANVLILGRISGTVATLLGGMLLMQYFNETTTVALLNSLCSATGPLLALSLFKLHAKREVELTAAPAAMSFPCDFSLEMPGLHGPFGRQTCLILRDSAFRLNQWLLCA